MTIGIYKLVFQGTDRVYIGQSVNIEKRFRQHINSFTNKTATDKLLAAATTFGMPSLEIMDECTVAELDHLEDEFISIYDSVNLGFNTYSYANQAPMARGVDSGNSKYTEEQIIDSITYLINTISTLKNCESKFGVRADTLHNIVSNKSHAWVREYFGDSLDTIKINLVKANIDIRVSSCKNNYKVSIKQPTYPKVLSPEGIVYKVDNINEFAKMVGTISKSSLHRLLSGQVNTSKGWKVCQDVPV